jgi:Ca2+-binding EF-hand superfamily protein
VRKCSQFTINFYLLTGLTMSAFRKQESFQADKDVLESLNPADLAKVEAAFTSLDNDGNGYITTDELSDMLAKCEITVSEADLPGVMADLDIDGSGHINFAEFVTYYAGMQSGKGSCFSHFLTYSLTHSLVLCL